MPEEPSFKDRVAKLLQESQQSEEFSKMLRSALAAAAMEEDKDAKNSLTPNQIAKRLTEIYKVFEAKNQFSPGQLVKWKANLRNRRRPRYDEPAIVLTVLEKPICDESDEAASPYFQEPLNLALGMIDKDGDFLVYYYDSRRFEAF